MFGVHDMAELMGIKSLNTGAGAPNEQKDDDILPWVNKLTIEHNTMLRRASRNRRRRFLRMKGTKYPIRHPLVFDLQNVQDGKFHLILGIKPNRREKAS